MSHQSASAAAAVMAMDNKIDWIISLVHSQYDTLTIPKRLHCHGETIEHGLGVRHTSSRMARICGALRLCRLCHGVSVPLQRVGSGSPACNLAFDA
jgi:hypothetical protein